MEMVRWDVPIKASWYRATELMEVRFDRTGLHLVIIEEESECEWSVHFKNVQAFRSTTEECVVNLIDQLPREGGFFIVENSPWVAELGRGRVIFLEQSRHFVVACYDEVVEVVAWEAEIVPATPRSTIG